MGFVVGRKWDLFLVPVLDINGHVHVVRGKFGGRKLWIIFRGIERHDEPACRLRVCLRIRREENGQLHISYSLQRVARETQVGGGGNEHLVNKGGERERGVLKMRVR